MQQFKHVQELSRTETGISARLDFDWKLQIDILEPWLLRVGLEPDDGFTIERTWMIAPEGECPLEGRQKLSTEGFSCPDFALEEKKDSTALQSEFLRLDLNRGKLNLRIFQSTGKDIELSLQDRGTGSYYRSNHGHAVRHYQFHSDKNRYFGLGDKSGPLDRAGRRFRMLQLDALGYNAETGDPLYKHIPFVIVQNKDTGTATGLLYDCMSEMVFDLGCEKSNYHDTYRYVEAGEKGLCYYVIAGPTIADVVKRLAILTGKPHFQPRWSMGFGFTSMHHADAPNGQEVITNFARKCREREIPISSIHFGSGYTSRAGLRYVFTWNVKKFPDKGAMFSTLRELGYHTVANVKPMLLLDHPSYSELAAEGCFIADSNKQPTVSMFWDAEGSHIDFTAYNGLQVWKEGIKNAVLGAGFDAVWNDNNEAEIWDEDATVQGFGSPMISDAVHPLQSLLMTRASFEQLTEENPERRPYTITRAGCLGLQRYAETWTGDNLTSWHTLKWNLFNGLSLGLSGIPSVGHDVGGFTGPKADPELFVRWIQMMALHPRCVMNSWKPEEEEPANLPWMHSEVVDLVRDAFTLRYRLLPYLYTLAHHAHVCGEPIIRPLFYQYNDEKCYEQQDCFLLGENVLVATVVYPGQEQVSIYLPETEYGWYDYKSSNWYPGGQVIELDAPLATLPMLVRAGAVLPLASEWQQNSPHDATAIELVAFCPQGEGGHTSELFYDDGISWKFRENSDCNITSRLYTTLSEVHLEFERTNSQDIIPKLKVQFVGINDRKTIITGLS